MDIPCFLLQLEPLHYPAILLEILGHVPLSTEEF